MKILLTPLVPSSLLNPTLQPFTLADDTSSTAMLVGLQTYPNGAGGLVISDSGFIPSLSLATQVDELINSAYKQELPRGNAQNTWTFEVNRQATSFDALLMFCADHPPLIPLSGTLSLYIANTVRYLKNAVLIDAVCTKQKGTDFNFKYTIRGSYLPPISGTAGTGTGGPFTPS